MLTHKELRQKYASFWSERGHKEVPAIPLVPQNDPTTLFTGSGMQQFVPYLLGEEHPQGVRLYNIQPCLRAQDIEEIGDNRHTTSFEMMGNWSLGDYFKKDQLTWLFEFLVEQIGIPADKLYATVFKGDPTEKLPEDHESIEILQEIYRKYGIDARMDERIFGYGGTKNWWSRGGGLKNQPINDPGGPDSEVFYDFGAEHKFHQNSPWKNERCHVNCDCGRYIEIGNSVFMQYKKQEDGSFTELPKRNVDFGGGLERILAAANASPDVFSTDLYKDILLTIINVLGTATDSATNIDYKQYLPVGGKIYESPDEQEKVKNQQINLIRILADHLKGATFLIVNGVRPSNKEQGYILRRLLRRSAVKIYQLQGQLMHPAQFESICDAVLITFDGVQGVDRMKQRDLVLKTVTEEIDKFGKSLDHGLKEIKKLETVDGKIAFDFYQSYGFPLELTEELFKEKGITIDREEFRKEFENHKNLSRSQSAGKFKGGLADHSEQTVKYHTATHLLHQALFDVMGNEIRQEGSNITPERLRFDFYSTKKPDETEVKKITEIINERIKAEIPVSFKILPKEEAQKVGARSFFKEKYPDMVKVYYVGQDLESAYSKEFCGGPHVTNTKEIGKLEIYKLEKIGSNLFRIYAR